MAENKENNTKRKPASENLTPKRKKKSEPAAQSAQPSKEATKQKPKDSSEKPKRERKPIDENSMVFNLLPYLLSFSGLFILFCVALPDKTGLFGDITILLRGLLSYAVWAIPIFMFFCSFKLKKDILKGRVGQKFIFGTVCIIFLSVLTELIFIANDSGTSFKFSEISDFWKAACEYKNGGIIGGMLGTLLHKAAGSGAIIIALFAVLILGLFEFGCTPEDIFIYTKDKIRERYHDIKAKQRENKYIPKPVHEDAAAKTSAAQPPRAAQREENHSRTTYKCNRDLAYHLGKKNLDIDTDDKSQKKRSIFDVIEEEKAAEKQKEREALKARNEEEAEAFIENMKASYSDDPENSGITKTLSPVMDGDVTYPTDIHNADHSENKEISIDGIFADDAVIEAGGMAMGTEVLEAEVINPANGSEIISTISDNERVGLEVQNGKLAVESRPTIEELYSYPPLDLLKTDPNPATFTVTEELKATAVKLVETLSNFGVKTKILNISCGPTVTRYELQPEVGVRVRSIQNLSDDIALHLAASGVRIEAPIPGKDAVGIELPNKNVSTVYIRNLIENQQFRNLKSRISVCLGMDVAGSPIYMDIAKMPHLLIAGATGMGKSVCINSFIISILYKARPDEVKFILIDPKKVEFSLYKGIPHLLVPVVNEPKKAAGALSWAVSEMERRFVLIEEVGVRDIAGYNEVTKDDPEKPRMSQIVIIIDELADLMMTARDEVENSICRLAQKARAAGMHLVIGTQRPSVDVITGLLKANIPSRIACTVASQVDSRTIIDIAGAEKLIGKGDMLFAPVGCMKPIRVQGSFVSDSEVEAVTDFLKSNFTAEYDKSIIDDIEREAAKCGEKKKGKGDFSDGDSPSSPSDIMDSDEMILPAIQVAISAGQLSTSLLQRKLSLGYARAARIVDILEQMNVVSGFEGSKPRRVLITEEQFLEMKMNRDSSDN